MPTVTLGIYAQAMTSSDDERKRLRLPVEGGDLAVDGGGSEIERTQADRRGERLREGMA